MLISFFSTKNTGKVIGKRHVDVSYENIHFCTSSKHSLLSSLSPISSLSSLSPISSSDELIRLHRFLLPLPPPPPAFFLCSSFLLPTRFSSTHFSITLYLDLLVVSPLRMLTIGSIGCIKKGINSLTL